MLLNQVELKNSAFDSGTHGMNPTHVRCFYVGLQVRTT